MNYLLIEGARQNNLKNISLKIPHNKVTVITGVSGAGKSSLAIDTIFAESYRKYLESLSTYTRLFLEKADKPEVDTIRNLRPAICLEQRNTVRTSRSTVGTVTEIYDYLRLLFAKIGTIYCPSCEIPVHGFSPQSTADNLFSGELIGQTIYVTHFSKKPNMANLLKNGFTRIISNKKIYHLEEDPIHTSIKSAYVVIDKMKNEKSEQNRLVESLETAFREGAGTVFIITTDFKKMKFTGKLQCPKCDLKFKELQPNMFSFNHALSACPDCKGFGNLLQYDMDKVIPNQNLSIEQGAVDPWTKPSYSWPLDYLEHVRRNIPYKDLSSDEKNRVEEHLDYFFKELDKRRYKLHVRVFVSRYKNQFTCPSCQGSRLRKEALNIKIQNKNIHEVSQMIIGHALIFFNSIDSKIANDILATLRKKLDFLNKVGLSYLTIDRQTKTLSGGEAQRVNLAQQLGEGLTETLYILDEPTIGLHAKDINNLSEILHGFAQEDNTLILVEHDREIINHADFIIQLGPGAGEHGGDITFAGDSKYFKENLNIIPVPSKRRKGKNFLQITGASLHNLKNINVKIPLGCFTCVTGVSGSGKSSLIYETLYHAIAMHFDMPFQKPGHYKELLGLEHVKGIKLIDQEPLSRSPRSNPATYMGFFNDIRTSLSRTQIAKVAGLTAGSFSFNSGNGRCPACEGSGFQKMEMYFLSDIYYKCEECEGKRFKKEILEIKYNGKNIHDILQMTVTEALSFFDNNKKLQILNSVGLGYLRIGQPLTTLSGGETQRLKIAAELSTHPTKDFIYILDEPTTGLHVRDIKILLDVLSSLVENGNTVIVIEHNMDVIKCADYIIDLGPEGGEKGGKIIATGMPENVTRNKYSHTGDFLRKYL